MLLRRQFDPCELLIRRSLDDIVELVPAKDHRTTYMHPLVDWTSGEIDEVKGLLKLIQRKAPELLKLAASASGKVVIARSRVLISGPHNQSVCAVTDGENSEFAKRFAPRLTDPSEANRLFNTYYKRANEAKEHHDWKSAIADYKRASKIDPSAALPYHHIMDCYSELHDYDSALQYADQTLVCFKDAGVPKSAPRLQ